MRKQITFLYLQKNGMGPLRHPRLEKRMGLLVASEISCTIKGEGAPGSSWQLVALTSSGSVAAADIRAPYRCAYTT